jgi:hypothetical protein
MRRAVLHQGATLTVRPKNAWRDVARAGAFAQESNFPLAWLPLVGNAVVSER